QRGGPLLHLGEAVPGPDGLGVLAGARAQFEVRGADRPVEIGEGARHAARLTPWCVQDGALFLRSGVSSPARSEARWPSEGRWAEAAAGVEPWWPGIVRPARVGTGPVLHEHVAPAFGGDRVGPFLLGLLEEALPRERFVLHLAEVLLPGVEKLVAQLTRDEVGLRAAVADGGAADPPPGDASGLISLGVEQASGLHPVVGAAEPVEVLDGGRTAALGILEVELLDAVGLSDGHDVAGATGHRRSE